MNIDEITEARRRAIAESIHTISFEELSALGEKLFPYSDDPWRNTFFEFITQNRQATFHHATTNDEVQIIYCPAKDKGIWFVPNRGMGPLQARGLKVMNEVVLGG
ncbi:MAG: hypothetical protein PHC88_14095 [Terrimicrobiaceae bacterium]|nr:hypothetical protein [Terrimicrobiaceae bacterium]